MNQNQEYIKVFFSFLTQRQKLKIKISYQQNDSILLLMPNFYSYNIKNNSLQVIQSMKQRKTSKQITNFTTHKTNFSNLSPSAKNITKSPLSTSKCVHQAFNKQNVSYGQLQIVLDNIQQIRQKARVQVQILTDQNTNHKLEISQLQTIIADLTSKLRAQTAFQSEIDQKWKMVIQQIQEQKKNKDIYIESQNKQINEIQLKLRDTQHQISNQIEKSKRYQQEINGLNKKWNWAFTILSGNQQRQQELIWRVKNTANNLWQILQTYSTMSLTINVKNEKIATLTKEIQEGKQQNKCSSQMLGKSLDQLNLTNQKLSRAQQEIKQLNEKANLLEKQLQIKSSEFEKQNFVSKKQQNFMHEHIEELEQKIIFLTQELNKKEEQKVESERKKQFQNIVVDVCQQVQDYEKVLERVKYLQKFRNEHYFNIQKIQYLCKLIDN